MSMQLATQTVYAAAIGVAMIVAGLGKRRLEWKQRSRKRRKGKLGR
jgi:hypothetical protein